MTTSNILATLRSRGVTLAVENGKLQYRGSKDVLTPELIDELRHHKAELIALLEAEQAPAGCAPTPTPTQAQAGPIKRQRTPSIPRVSRDEPVPLALPQESLWFLHRIDPENVADHVWAAWTLEGEIDRDIVQRTLDTLVTRHEALRIYVADDGDEAFQRITDRFPAPLEYHSIKHLPADERESEQDRILKAFYRRPFDLLSPPLVRFMLLEVADNRHVMLWTGHHIIMDGGSLAVMQQDFAACYAAYVEGRQPQLAELEVQYPDFAVWQRNQVAGDRLEELEAFWKKAIPDGLAPLELPIDRPRPAVQGFEGGDMPFHLPADVTAAMRKTAGAAGCTLFVGFLATLKILLHRLTGQEDIAVGAPMFLRDEPELAPIVGMLLNTLPIATSLADNPTCRDLMRRERQALMGAFAHKQLPFQKLVEAVQPERDPSRNPLFQVMFEMLQDQPLELPGIEAKPLRVARGVSQFDITAHFREERQGGIEGFIEYNADLFDPSTIERLLGHWSVVIEAVAANPDLKVSEVPLLSDADRRKMLVEWNATTQPFPSDKGIHHLIAETAAARPDATALVCGDESLTYAELDARANSLARHLKSLGVGRDIAVGLSVKRSLELVVAALAIMKAGGAYVPLDPTYPRVRRGFMIEDTHAPVIVTTSDLVDDLPAHDAEVVVIDTEWDQIGRLDDSPVPQDDFSSDQLAYTIFTSGSTGRPKGVMVEHRNVTYNLTGMDGILGFAPGRDEPGTWLSITSLSFDPSVIDLFWTLSRGFKVVIYDDALDEDDNSPGSIPSLIETHAVTHTQCVPTRARMLLASERGAASLAHIRKLLIGGEALTPELAKPLCHHIGGDVINVYGPTETTVWSWGHCVSPNEDPIPIGRPMANARFYVLDPYGQPVPVGVPGELYIAGPGVTRGYAERPDVTAKAFIPDPFNPEGGRMYRTGDRVAARPDGVLDYLGRLDFQVKIRGFRVELSEIEAAITNASPGPVHAVVTAWSPSPTDTRLVAYIVPETASEIDTGALRAAVERTMPDYMVPQYFQVLDAFPKTASGKIDRKRLPEPNADAAAEEREIVPPRNDKEEQLFRIWGEVLGDKSVSRTDRFFARGGHSLLAMMLVGRIEKELGHRVPLRSVLTGALSDIADTLPGAGIETAADDGARIAVADRNAGGIAIAPSQEPLWIVHRLDPDNVSDHISFGWTLEGPLNGEALEMSVKAMMDRHESLRLSIEARKDGAVLRIEEAIAPPLHFQKLAATTDDETGEVCDRICKEFVRQPFDFSTAPLFRILVLECEPERHIVLMVFHHIIVDGVSLDVLIDELSRHYNAIVETGRPASLAPLKLDYADFAAWQRADLTGQRVADLKDFWKAAVAADLPPLDLPTDRPRPPVQSYHGATTHCMLPEASLQKLRVESQAAGCSLYVAMMASLKTLFHRLTNQEHVVVGAPVALRENADLSDMVGMVLNTLPVHTRLSGDLTFADVLRRENASFLDALEHQALPFHRIVEAVSPPRDPSRNPLFQIMLEMRERGDLDLKGLTLEPLAHIGDTAQFDMAVYVDSSSAGTEAFVQYNSDLFDASTIERLLANWTVVIEAVAANPDVKVSEVALLADDERAKMLVEWNATTKPFAADKGIHHLIAETAAARPDATALVCGDESLTYAELDARANRLARHLKSLGVGRDVAVGLSLERSLDLLVGALGILKAGGAYVPMDPAYPRDRRGFMVEDSAAPVIVTASHLVGDLPEHDAKVVQIDTDWPKIEALSAAPLDDQDFSPDQLAYVIFTSGSTGRPKGVMVEHRNASNFFTAMDGVVEPDGDNPGTWLAVTSLSFDISVLELFWTLARGFKVVVYAEVADEGEDSAGSVPSLIAGHGVTHMQCVPAMARMQVASDAGRTAFQRLQKLLIGGEAFPGTLAEDLIRHVGGDVINMYGPTETTVWSSSHPAIKGVDTVPIGRPVANTEFYVLDAYGQPVPVGVPGELFIGGAGVTRGYIGRDDLTEERFIENTFSPAGGRLYRTGDRVAYRADGVLEYLGRLDFQVKIRGFRIELGEIEAAVSDVAPVPVHAVVGTWAPQPDDVRLVAYLETDKPDAIETSQLREALKGRLPDYMIPQHVVTLDTFPKTANGKIDRKRLPEPLQIARASEPKLSQGIEQDISELWERRLYVTDISKSDSFFDLGGHSLSAVEVSSDIAAAFDVAFTPRDLIEDPTLGGVIRRVEALIGGDTGHEDAVRDIPLADIMPPALGGKTDSKQPSMKRHESFWKGLKNRLLQVIALHAPGMSTFRVRLHRARGVKIDGRLTIGTDVILDTSSPHLISIGKNVQIGVRATFVAHFGDMTPTGPDAAPTIRIEDDVYIGPNVTILPNVTVGRGSVVTAGSVVNRSIPPGTVAQGNPALPVARCAVPLAWRSYAEFAASLSPITSTKTRKAQGNGASRQPDKFA